MRILTIISFLLFYTVSHSQPHDIIRLAFSDPSNFDITTRLGNKVPAVYYVLNKTDAWNTYRFHLDEDLTSEGVRKELERNEHSPYNHSYIFKNIEIDSLFTSSEKEQLFNAANAIQPRQLSGTFHEFTLIEGFSSAANGFFFSITDPIFTAGGYYAFIEITSYVKSAETEDIRSAYFASTLLIYRLEKGKGWTRVKKLSHLIL